jgi:hypothetical protein
MIVAGIMPRGWGAKIGYDGNRLYWVVTEVPTRQEDPSLSQRAGSSKI